VVVDRLGLRPQIVAEVDGMAVMGGLAGASRHRRAAGHRRRG
jgi:hypothetical protein